MGCNAKLPQHASNEKSEYINRSNEVSLTFRSSKNSRKKQWNPFTVTWKQCKHTKKKHYPKSGMSWKESQKGLCTWPEPFTKLVQKKKREGLFSLQIWYNIQCFFLENEGGPFQTTHTEGCLIRYAFICLFRHLQCDWKVRLFLFQTTFPNGPRYPNLRRQLVVPTDPNLRIQAIPETA